MDITILFLLRNRYSTASLKINSSGLINALWTTLQQCAVDYTSYLQNLDRNINSIIALFSCFDSGILWVATVIGQLFFAQRSFECMLKYNYDAGFLKYRSIEKFLFLFALRYVT